MSEAPLYIIESFDRRLHDRSSFDCGEDALNEYLKKRASQEVRRQVAAVFIIRERDHIEVIGFYTLSASSLDLSALPATKTKGIPYPQVPVTLLGRMGIDKKYQKQGLGRQLLLSAFARSLQATESVASLGVVIDAKSEDASRFYRHIGMLDLGNGRFFISMNEIASGVTAATT